MTLGALETDPPHEMSCLSETKATIRRESGARVVLSCVHTFEPGGACRPHVSPDQALLAQCVAVPACRERNTSPGFVLRFVPRACRACSWFQSSTRTRARTQKEPATP